VGKYIKGIRLKLKAKSTKSKIRLYIMLMMFLILMVLGIVMWRRTRLIRNMTNIASSFITLFSRESKGVAGEDEYMEWVWSEPDGDVEWGVGESQGGDTLGGSQCPPPQGSGEGLGVGNVDGGLRAQFVYIANEIIKSKGSASSAIDRVLMSLAFESGIFVGTGGNIPLMNVSSDGKGTITEVGSLLGSLAPALRQGNSGTPAQQNQGIELTRNDPRTNFKGNFFNHPGTAGIGYPALSPLQFESLGRVKKNPIFNPTANSQAGQLKRDDTYGHMLFWPDLIYSSLVTVLEPTANAENLYNVIAGARPEQYALMDVDERMMLRNMIGRVSWFSDGGLSQLASAPNIGLIAEFYMDYIKALNMGDASSAHSAGARQGNNGTDAQFVSGAKKGVFNSVLSWTATTLGKDVQAYQTKFAPANLKVNTWKANTSRTFGQPIWEPVAGITEAVRQRQALMLDSEVGTAPPVGPPPVPLPIPAGCPGGPPLTAGVGGTCSLNGWVWPSTVKGHTRGVSGGHKGIDVGGTGHANPSRGESILAVRDGVVLAVRNDYEQVPNANAKDGGGFGNLVIIYHGTGHIFIYAHNYPKSATVTEGQFVKAGQVIARIGNSGSTESSGHVHVEAYEWFKGKRMDTVTPENAREIYEDKVFSGVKAPVSMIPNSIGGISRGNAVVNPFGITVGFNGFYDITGKLECLPIKDNTTGEANSDTTLVGFNGWVVPTSTEETSGMRGFGINDLGYINNRWHMGNDFYGSNGQDVVAVADGTVMRTRGPLKNSSTLAQSVIIRHEGPFKVRGVDLDFIFSVYQVYGSDTSSRRLDVRPGDKVKVGQVIGRNGTLPLHFEVRRHIQGETPEKPDSKSTGILSSAEPIDLNKHIDPGWIFTNHTTTAYNNKK
jgi:murein DD-endopeptidase MepM/ murein hydrolase activator NlpD